MVKLLVLSQSTVTLDVNDMYKHSFAKARIVLGFDIYFYLHMYLIDWTLKSKLFTHVWTSVAVQLVMST